MTASEETPIRFRVDPTNPGQFFACCGLLELADRLWNGVEGWFEKDGCQFCLRPQQISANQKIFSSTTIINELAACSLSNTMTVAQLARRDLLSTFPKKQMELDSDLETEKKELDKLWRESPIVLHTPFNILLNWFVDGRAGGSDFKTWAGQQSVIDIARGMKIPVDAGRFSLVSSNDWLRERITNDSLPFNFDSDLGGVGSDRDVGFSFDPLKTIKVQSRPLLELFAFVGLQRFRPVRIKAENRYQFFLWLDPLGPEVAATASCGLLASPRLKAFEFRLLYRTKYLKSFLTATPLKRS